MSAVPIQAVEGVAAQGRPTASQAAGPPGVSFEKLILGGIDKVNQQIATADKLTAAFAVDDSIPVHQVTYALAQAQMSMEMLMQIRSQLVAGYQEIMRMQL